MDNAERLQENNEQIRAIQETLNRKMLRPIDSELSETSENAVQNKVITTELNAINSKLNALEGAAGSNKLDKLESSDNKALVNVTKDGQLEKTEFTVNHLIGLKEQDLSPSKNVLKLENGTQPTPGEGLNYSEGGFSNTYNTVAVNNFVLTSYDMTIAIPAIFPEIVLEPNTTYTISGKIKLPVNNVESGTGATVDVYPADGTSDVMYSHSCYNQSQTQFIGTFVTTEVGTICIQFTPAVINQGIANGAVTEFYDLQIEKGGFATEFEPYRDAPEEDKVVYQSDLEPVKTQVTEAAKALEESKKAINFAESERQKSKNLLDLSSVPTTDTIKPNGTGLKIISAGNNLNTGGGLYNVCLEANKTYTISGNLVSTTQDGRLCIRWTAEDGTVYWGPGFDGSDLIVSFEKKITEMLLYIEYYETAGTYVEVTNFQIEEGRVATAYQPYSGEIVHENNKAIVFAESEREKSKNLFYFSGTATKNRVGVDFSWDSATQSITLTGTCTGTYSTGFLTGLTPITLKAGVTYSFILSNTSTKSVNIRLLTADQKKEILINSREKSKQFTFSQDVTLTLGYLDLINGQSYSDTFKLCIIKGVDNVYREYNGEIIHKKALEERTSKYKYSELWGGAISAGTVININGNFNDYKALMYRAIINDVTRLVHYHPLYEIHGQFIFADDGQYVVFEYQSVSSIKIIAKSNGANWLQIYGVK